VIPTRWRSLIEQKPATRYQDVWYHENCLRMDPEGKRTEDWFARKAAGTGGNFAVRRGYLDGSAVDRHAL